MELDVNIVNLSCTGMLANWF